MGIYFTDSLVIFDRKEKCQFLKPQLEINIDNELIHNRWNKISAIYTATGQEEGIIIGNFYTDEDTEIIPISKLSKRRPKLYVQNALATYYGIDMVKLWREVLQDKSQTQQYQQSSTEHRRYV